MKNLIILLVINLSVSASIYTQVLETKNWCLSNCDISGDERTNTELIYALSKHELTKINDQNTKLKYRLRVGIIKNDTPDQIKILRISGI